MEAIRGPMGAFTLQFSHHAHPALFAAGLLVLALADAWLVFVFKGTLVSFLPAHGARIGRLLVLGLVIGVGLSAWGVFRNGDACRHRRAEEQGPPPRADCACVSWGRGVAWSVDGRGRPHVPRISERNASMALILLPAFPIALGLFALLAAVALLFPYGKTVAMAMWLACLLPLLRWRPPKSEVMRIAVVLLGILPFAGFFGLWMGLLWHGPTEELVGYPSGDLVFYATSMWSLATQPYPFTDFAFANAGPLSYFNMLYSAFGAALIELPGFDPFLYILAAGGTSFILFSGLALHLYVSDRAAKSLDTASVLILLLSLLRRISLPGVRAPVPEPGPRMACQRCSEVMVKAFHESVPFPVTKGYNLTAISSGGRGNPFAKRLLMRYRQMSHFLSLNSNRKRRIHGIFTSATR